MTFFNHQSHSGILKGAKAFLDGENMLTWTVNFYSYLKAQPKCPLLQSLP